EDVPPKPSTRVSTLGDASTEVARGRRTDPGTLSRSLRGDLDWITMRALEKDRTRRYESASEFRADVVRHLNDEPVLAGPPGLGYQVRKLARRYRGQVAAALVIGLALAGGAVAHAAYLQIQLAEEGERRQAALDGRRAAAALTERTRRELLRSWNSRWDWSDPDAEVRIDQQVARFEASPPQDILEEAETREDLGWAYGNLGLFDKAEHHLQRALDLRRQALLPDDPRILRNSDRLALLLKDRGRLDLAVPLYRESAALKETSLGARHTDTLETKSTLAEILLDMGKVQEAYDLVTAVQAVRREALGGSHEETLEAMHLEAACLVALGRYEAAGDLFAETVALRSDLLGELHEDTLNSRNDLAALLLRRGQGEEAESILREVVDALSRTASKDDPRRLTALSNLGNALGLQKKYGEAETVYRDLLALWRTMAGRGHSMTFRAMIDLGAILMRRGQVAGSDSQEGRVLLTEAESLYRMAAENRKRIRGEEQGWAFTVARNNLGRILIELGRAKEAEPILRRAWEEARQHQADWNLPEATVLVFQTSYGICLGKLGEFEEAEDLLQNSYAGLRDELGDANSETVKVLSYLIDLYYAWGKEEKAETLRRRLPVSETPGILKDN
ncbi:MAG: tetratricopeptide repeat protein, partial [Planctomycetota bacterium]|nr:tetratricopeptide repeat protein [Planctomycetota bacterium]